MTTQTTDDAVRTSVTVEVPIERAFTVFTDEIDSWWDPDHHLIEAEFDRMVFEPRVGGHVYDIGVDGSECRWARVLAYDPPDRFVISWDINTSWELETDLERTSEVEVRFVAEGPERTRVELEHRNLDRHGEGWEERMRDAVASDEGWPAGLRRFADVGSDVAELARLRGQLVAELRVRDLDQAHGALADRAPAQLGDAVLGDHLVDDVLVRGHRGARVQGGDDPRDRLVVRGRVQDDERLPLLGVEHAAHVVGLAAASTTSSRCPATPRRTGRGSRPRASR